MKVSTLNTIIKHSQQDKDKARELLATVLLHLEKDQKAYLDYYLQAAIEDYLK